MQSSQLKSHSITSLSSHANYRYLTTPQRSLRLKTLQKRFDANKKVVSQLQEKVKRLLDTQGLNVQSSLEDLVTVMNQHENDLISRCDEDSFQMLFWKQQCQALSKGTGVRWHPLMIKFCLYLHHCSSKAYKVLRNSKCLQLLSQRTLRDYSHCNMSGAGFSTASDEQLREYVNPGETLSCKSLVEILFDEMHIVEMAKLMKILFNQMTIWYPHHMRNCHLLIQIYLVMDHSQIPSSLQVSLGRSNNCAPHHMWNPVYQHLLMQINVVMDHFQILSSQVHLESTTLTITRSFFEFSR